MLMEVISSPSGNGSKGVVAMLLRLLLKIDEESVASFHQITRASPKSRMSQDYAGVDNILGNTFIRVSVHSAFLFI